MLGRSRVLYMRWDMLRPSDLVLHVRGDVYVFPFPHSVSHEALWYSSDT